MFCYTTTSTRAIAPGNQLQLLARAQHQAHKPDKPASLASTPNEKYNVNIRNAHAIIISAICLVTTCIFSDTIIVYTTTLLDYWITGTCNQYLFNTRRFSSWWYTCVRRVLSWSSVIIFVVERRASVPAGQFVSVCAAFLLRWLSSFTNDDDK